jgi:hypothetical protein
VLAVFRRSFYVETGAGLACVGPLSMGDGPLNALCDLPQKLDWGEAGLRHGSAVSMAAGRSAWSIDLRGAEIWRPRSGSRSPEKRIVRDRLAELGGASRAFARTEGFAPLIGEPGRFDTPILRAAREPIAAAEAWLVSRTGAPPAAVLDLLGLGPGLTPSGDDYLGGTMVALRAIGRGGDAKSLAERVVPAASLRTGRISSAHLACAAEGEGAAALHDAIGVVLGAPCTRADVCLSAIDAIGHTSGWDALAGAVAALRAAAG